MSCPVLSTPPPDHTSQQAIPDAMPLWNAGASIDVNQLLWELGHRDSIFFNLQAHNTDMSCRLANIEAAFGGVESLCFTLQHIDRDKGYKISDLKGEVAKLKDKVGNLEAENRALKETVKVSWPPSVC